MLKRKYSIIIAILFLGIFAGKMTISFAPIFFTNLDKSFVNSVIMQIEEEKHGDSAKEKLKFVDHKLLHNRSEEGYTFVYHRISGLNSFIEHYRRYVNPYHPSVPTPPPNLS